MNYQGLSDASQDAFRRITLRWHDLRHEYASRLVEHGVPLAQVRDLLGHASITTTERYDNQPVADLKIAAAKLDAGTRSRPLRAQSFRILSRSRCPTRGRTHRSRSSRSRLTSWQICTWEIGWEAGSRTAARRDRSEIPRIPAKPLELAC